MNNAARAAASLWASVHPGYTVRVSDNLSDRFVLERDGVRLGVVTNCGSARWRSGLGLQNRKPQFHKTLARALDALIIEANIPTMSKTDLLHSATSDIVTPVPSMQAVSGLVGGFMDRASYNQWKAKVAARPAVED